MTATTTTTTIRTKRHGMRAVLTEALERARSEGLPVADGSPPMPSVTHEPVPSELQRVFGIGRRIGKTVITTEMLRAAIDPAGAEALAAAEAKRERKAAKRERVAQRQGKAT